MPTWLSDFITHGALLRSSPDRVCLAFGPWRRAAAPVPGQLNFYAPDFYLRDEAPWYLPEDWREEDFRAVADAIPTEDDEPAVAWRMPTPEAFAAGFYEVHRRIEGDGLDKAVPIAIERAAGTMSRSRLGSLLRKLAAAPPELVPYGLWDGEAGILGATPEILAHGDAGSVRTMALAGTRPRTVEGTPWDDAKEIREHEVVATNIVEALALLGDVTRGERRIVRLPTMEHWLTDISLTPRSPVSLDKLVRALHPTPALGVAPRAYGYHWLEAFDGGDRGRFGAPFGVVRPDGSFLAVVAIRNVQWTAAEWRLAAGCGVIRESHLEREWEELALKRRSVKGLLAL